MRRVRLGTILTTLVLVTSVPLAGLAAWLSWTSGAQQQALIAAQNIEKVRIVSSSIDTEIERTWGGLATLGTLAPLGAADVSRFSEIATRMLPVHPAWDAVRLIDRTQQVIASTEPGDQIFGDPEWIGRIFETGSNAVSTLRQSRSGQWVVNVGMPVVRAGKVQYVLAARLRARALTTSLLRQQPPDGGVLTLLDVNHAIIARTRNEELYLGRQATPDFVARVRAATFGSQRAVMLEGTPAYSAWFRSPVTGWTTALGTPSESIDGPLRRRAAVLIAAAVGTLGVGLVIAILLGRSIVRAQVGAAVAARALARGEPVPVVRSYIADLDDLGVALRDAAAILEQRLRERDAAAEALSRAKDNFIATVSHELRTPLNAIYGWVAMLRTGSLDAARQEHALKVIERNARAQSQVVEDLLDMSSIVHGRLRLETVPVDLSAVVRIAVDAVTPIATERVISINVTGAQTPLMVTGDPARLQQILWNLLANGLKFTPSQGRIDVSVGTDGDQAVVTVADNGEGIAPEFLPHVFDHFRQESEQLTRQHSGLGIGLALARNLTELQAGTITAMSQGKGTGSTFTVRFPLRPDAA
jgi:signal transduction histidine kinase